MRPAHAGYAIIVCALACLALGAALGVRWSIMLHDSARLEGQREAQLPVAEQLDELAHIKLVLAASDSVCMPMVSFPANVFAGPPEERCIWGPRPTGRGLWVTAYRGGTK
jgi:hypothetical protein